MEDTTSRVLTSPIYHVVPTHAVRMNTSSGPALGPDDELISVNTFGDAIETVEIPSTPEEGTQIESMEVQFVEGHVFEETLANKLIPEVVFFYHDEMKRFLADDLYEPTILREIHENLKTRLKTQFLNGIDLIAEQKHELREQLSTSLDKASPRHSQRNSENWKMKQAKISKLLQRMMSSYMEQIESLLQRHPDGLDEQALEDERDMVIAKVLSQLEFEIKGTVREREPMEGHLNSLRAEIKEYWECVVERNNQNLENLKKEIARIEHDGITCDNINMPESAPVGAFENGFVAQSANVDVRHNLTPQAENNSMEKVTATRELNDLCIVTNYHIKTGNHFKFILDTDLYRFRNILEGVRALTEHPATCTLADIREKIQVVRVWIARFKI